MPKALIGRILLFCVFFLVIPIAVASRITHYSFIWLFGLYAVALLVAVYLMRKNFSKEYRVDSDIQLVNEELNLLEDGNRKALAGNYALQAKIKRYSNMRSIVEDINQSLELSVAAGNLVSSAFSLIAENNGTCVLYLADPKTGALNLFKSKKDDVNLVIKAKEGDIFDWWVMRHNTALLIHDIKSDFRFDPERLKSQDLRNVSSLISAPLLSETKFLGIIRLDNPKPNFYTQDDLRFLSSICDVGQMAIENCQLFSQTQDLAIHDGLTLLYTKGYFLERLKDECSNSLRHKNVFSLLMIDIDHFKAYNDKFGHTAGDIVLKKISQAATDFFKQRSTDVARFGGEEFCVLLPGVDAASACQMADALRQKISAEKIMLRRQETGVTVSVGVASFPEHAQLCDDLLIKADKAMYNAKQSGRNRVCCIQ